MTDQEIQAGVHRLQLLQAIRRRDEARDRNKLIKTRLRLRREAYEAGKLKMCCECEGCLRALVTENPAHLCLTGRAQVYKNLLPLF